MQTPSANSRTGLGSFSDAAQSPQGPPPMGQTFSSAPAPVPVIPAAQRPSSGGHHERSFSHSSGFSQSNMAPQQQYPPRNSMPMAPAGQPAVPSSRFNTGSTGAQGPPQLGALSFQNAQQPSQPAQQAGPQQPPQQPSQQPLPQAPANPLMQNPPANRPGSQGKPQPPPQLAPSKPVFGISLGRLYERDNMAVPMVVYQCIQAVDLFGINVEGIYRLSGSVPHVNRLKAMFDTGKAS